MYCFFISLFFFSLFCHWLCAGLFTCLLRRPLAVLLPIIFFRSFVPPLKLVYVFLSPFFFLSVPLGSPVNISAQNTSSTSIKISWKPVSEILRLGIISKYVFNITNLLTGDLRTIEFDGSSLSGEVRNLSKFQEYSIQGAAVNSKGQSNFTSAITCRTSEDSKSASLFRIYFKEPYPLGD